MKTILLDGDIVAYQAGYGLEESYHWEPGVTSTESDLESAKDKVGDMVSAWMDATGANDVVFCLSCPSHRYWRHDVLSTYKYNRDPSRRPRILEELRTWMAATFRSYVRPNLEADDVIGILATNHKIIPGEKIIVSSDKDFFQLPGVTIFQMHRPEEGLIHVGEVSADVWFFMQALMGDPTDGYHGCWKIGEKTARQIVTYALGFLDPEPCTREQRHRRLWDAVVGTYRMQYRKYGISRDPEQDALTQARVCRILRATDYNFYERRPILWTPPKLEMDASDFPLWKFKSAATITNV